MGIKTRAIICFIGVAFTAVLFIPSATLNQKQEASASVVKPVPGQAVGDTVIKLISVVRPDLSIARRQILARTFVRVSTDVLENEEQGKYFAILVAVESKYNPDAVSPAGAIGLAQIMPQFAKDFAKLCGVGDFKPDDLKDEELNLTLGACLFRALVTTYKGNLASALVAYNSGVESMSLKKLQSLSNINPESANYVAKFMYLNEAMNKKGM